MINNKKATDAAKRCLILSDGPVPTPEHSKVEGGGLRCWGLAKGLLSHNNIDVTVAYFDNYKKTDQFTDFFEGIKLATWSIDTLPDLIKDFDTIVVSYCMGQLSQAVVDAIDPAQQLILDCYVPIYVEASARQSSNVDAEYASFHAEIGRFSHVLKRGDFFLCANKPQKRYYQGVLSAIGRINPVTYAQDLIIVAPYGIYRDKPVSKSKPIEKLIGKNDKKYKKVLWFGGIYPWFDLNNLIDGVVMVNKTVPTKLVIVGAKNPFNSHPDFTRKYDELVSYVHTNKLEDTVILQDWINFNDRADWYLDSDVVVVVNKEGIENELSWRTRIVDFVWAELPILTNGGDPLSDILISQDAAIKMHGLDASSIASDLLNILSDASYLKTMRINTQAAKKDLYWDVVTEKISLIIKNHTRSLDISTQGLYDAVPQVTYHQSKIKKVFKKVKMIPAYQKKYGTRSTYFAIRAIVSKQVKKRISYDSNTKPKLVVISHQLDMSGAPFVLMDMMKELKEKSPATPVDFYTFNPAHKNNIAELNRMGIKPRILLDREVGMSFNQNDVVLLNTVGHSNQLKASIYEALEKNVIKKLIWYIHEDEPELIFTGHEHRFIKEMLNNDRITIITAAKKTRDNYQAYFGNATAITTQVYKVVTPDIYHKVRQSKEFDKLKFILPGTVSDGRKGQLPIFYAFIYFYNVYFKNNEKAYRDFELTFVGMDSDFLSRQLMHHAEKGLGDRFKFIGRVTKEQCLEYIIKSNITVCYSMRECLPLFVFEGMSAGHPILRNDSSGIEEQLIEGKNGFKLDSSDFLQIVSMIEKLANKSKISNEELSHMSQVSYDIAKKQELNSYMPTINIINNLLPKATSKKK